MAALDDRGAVLFVFGYPWDNQHQRSRQELPAIGAVLVRPPGGISGFRLADPRGPVFNQERLFTADSDRAGIAADLAALHQQLDLLLPEGT